MAALALIARATPSARLFEPKPISNNPSSKARAQKLGSWCVRRSRGTQHARQPGGLRRQLRALLCIGHSPVGFCAGGGLMPRAAQPATSAQLACPMARSVQHFLVRLFWTRPGLELAVPGMGPCLLALHGCGQDCRAHANLAFATHLCPSPLSRFAKLAADR